MCHLALNDLFSLGSDLLLHILFESPEHEWLQNQMKPLQLMLVELTLIHRVLLDIF